jgi:threonine aldolase
MAHCERGDEYIVGQTAHTYMWEGGGAAVLGSIQPQPLDFEEDGSLLLSKVVMAIKVNNDHHPRSKLLCLENTVQGQVLSLSYLTSIKPFCVENNLSSHLDGARVFNAAVALNISLDEISCHFDSLSVCLSKGLGAPVGSVLCGSKDIIQKARRWRKVVGGGMRQAGILAAAGIYALEHQVERLALDHENAHYLAYALADIEEMSVNIKSLHTNMFTLQCNQHYAPLRQHLYEKGFILPKQPNKLNNIRLVTHLDVSKNDVVKMVEIIKIFFCKG